MNRLLRCAMVIAITLLEACESGVEVYRAIEKVIMTMMMNEIFDAKTPFVPTDTPHKDCPSCPYNAICGTQWVRGWRG